MRKSGDSGLPSDRKNEASRPPGLEKNVNLASMRNRSKMFTKNGGRPPEDGSTAPSNNANERLIMIKEHLERPRDGSNPYKIAFLGASPDAGYRSTDSNILNVRDPRLKKIKIERDGNLWKVTYENENDKHTFHAEELFLEPEVGEKVPPEDVDIKEMFERGIVNSKTFIHAHNKLSEKKYEAEAATHKKQIKKDKMRITFWREPPAEGANFRAQGEGYGVTLIDISKEEAKAFGLYRYAPYSLAKMAAIEILKGQEEFKDEPIPKKFRAAINQLDPTGKVEAAEKMKAEEAAKNTSARELLSKYIPQDVIADLEKGPIDLAYGPPPSGKIYDSSLKSVEISTKGDGVKVTLQDGQVIEERLLVLGKENSAVSVLSKQDLEGLVPYLRDGNIVGVQTPDGSMKILDTTPDPRLPPRVNEILYQAGRGIGKPKL